MSFCNKECHDNWQRKFKNNLWENPEYVKNVMKGLNAKPNKAETKLNNWLQENFLNEYEYNGNFELEISIGGKVPDFSNINGQKKLIELFGENFHSNLYLPKIKTPYNRTYQGTIEHYKKHGYDCLIIWYKELRNKKKVIERIRGFTYQT